MFAESIKSIMTQEKEKPLHAKRNLRLQKNEKKIIITILKAKGNFKYINEQAASKGISKQHIRR